MTNIILNGSCGKMGKAVIEVASTLKDKLKIVAGVDKNYDSNFATLKEQINFFNDFPQNIEANVIVDFSNPSALESLLNFATKKNLPIVIATTGYSKLQIEKINYASKCIPIFFTFNMSIGINLILNLAKKATKFLGQDFNIEIIEKHHNQKIDAPSGTALMIADAINEEANGIYNYIYDRHSKREKRKNNEIGIHSIRAGSIVGDHEIIFANNDEIISISHSAKSKKIFAAGALKAALFLTTKPAGLYKMEDMLKN